MIGAHYDTRPHPDQEVLQERHNLPFVGANDPARASPFSWKSPITSRICETHWGVDLVLFDGEELVFGDEPRVGEYFLGSEEFARIYAEQVRSRRTAMRYEAGIVLDMVGGRNLRIKQEPTSLRAAPQLMREVWAIAKSAEIHVVSVRERSRGPGRPPRPDSSRHPDHRSHRLRLPVLAQSRRPARELLRREPGRCHPRGRGLAHAATPPAQSTMMRAFVCWARVS